MELVACCLAITIREMIHS